MLMNFLTGAVLFLIVGAFNYVSGQETAETADSIKLDVKPPQNVLVAVNEVLELNCTTSSPILHPAKLLFQHNNLWIQNNTYVINNYTVQLKKFHTSYKDAGHYRCGIFYASSKSQDYTAGHSQNVTVVVGEKPAKPILRLVDVFGRPVQELTIQWQANTNITYELTVGRVHNGSLRCEFNRTQIPTWTTCIPGSKHDGILSYHVTRQVLGQLFTWSELYKVNVEHCGFSPPGWMSMRCDQFCAHVVAKNAFGTSHSGHVKWNLGVYATCPPPSNLNVILKDHSMTVSWQRPSLVSEPNVSVFYTLKVTVSSVLTGKMLQPPILPLGPFPGASYTIQGPFEPSATYRFGVSCCFSPSDCGPPTYTEVISQEKAPSAVPICEVQNRSSDGQAYVMVKIPPKKTWNGIPRKIVFYYGKQQKIINVSLEELHKNRSLVIGIKDLDTHTNYSLTVAFCTAGGCGENSTRCIINAVSEDVIPEDVRGAKKLLPVERIKWEVWLTISCGLFIGLVMIAVILYWRQRSRREKPLPKLSDVFSASINSIHGYENQLDDKPNMCEESTNYARIRSSSLLNNVDCSVGNMSVSKL